MTTTNLRRSEKKTIKPRHSQSSSLSSKFDVLVYIRVL